MWSGKPNHGGGCEKRRCFIKTEPPRGADPRATLCLGLLLSQYLFI